MRAMRWVIGAAVLLVGCGGTPDRDRVIQLHVLVWKANNPHAWDEALRRFHAAHPGIRVVLEEGPNSSTQLHDLLAQKLRNRDTSLDAFLMDVVWPPEFAAAGWTLPLDNRFSEEDRSRFFPGCMSAVTYEGAIHGVPFFTDSGVLYYRRDLLAARGFDPPRTWNELVEQAGKLGARWGFSGQFRQYEGLVCNMLEFVHAHGGDLMHPSSPVAVEAVRFVRDRIIGTLAPRGVLTYQEQESLDLFKSGGAAFLRSWPYAWTILEDPAHSEVAGRVGIARLPAFEGGRSVSTLGGWSFGIHRHSRHPDEAWAFVRFMTGPEMQRHFAIRVGKAPARRELYADPAVLEANPHFAELRPVFETATPRPRSPIYPRISHILQRYFHQALSDPESAIEELARTAEEQIEGEMARIAAAE